MNRWIFAAALLALAGCLDLQSAFHYPALHTDYSRTGYVVRDDQRVFRYDSVKNLSTLQIGKNLRYEDAESDGRVDRITAGRSTWTRGEPGTEDLFRVADRRWDEITTYLSTGHIKETWSDMSPQEIADRWERTRHDP